MKENERFHYTQYAEALAERFHSGMLEQLQDYDQFVCWKHTPGGKKIPFTPSTGEYARTDDENTWGTLEQSLKALRTGRYTGIGFVFSENDNFTGVDIDHAIKDGQLSEQTQELITQFWSYAEISPSGTGIHILVEGEVPEGRRKDGIEIYSSKRFFTITTRHLKGSPETIEYRQTELDKLYASLRPPEPRRQPIKPQEHLLFMSDEKVLEKALNAANGDSFSLLWQGSVESFASKSHADWELVMRLCYWCNDDPAQVRRLFLQSALVDSKTLSARGDSTYLDITIKNAIIKRNHM